MTVDVYNKIKKIYNNGIAKMLEQAYFWYTEEYPEIRDTINKINKVVTKELEAELEASKGLNNENNSDNSSNSKTKEI